MKFSERLGFKKPKLELQIDEVDQALKSGLWDSITLYYFSNCWEGDRLFQTYGYTDGFDITTDHIWHHFYKRPMDSKPNDPQIALSEIRQTFLSSKFPETYDFLEFVASLNSSEYGQENEKRRKSYIEFCNRILEREKSAFRFVSSQLTQITNKTEIEEIETAQGQRHSKSVSTHIDSAVALYSNRADPDYRNSIKESISAVEAAARRVLGDEKITLGAALKKLEKENQIHPSLKNGLSSLYGWTNDSSGIRHAKMDDEDLTEADARYMLVSCSAFANYLLSKI